MVFENEYNFEFTNVVGKLCCLNFLCFVCATLNELNPIVELIKNVLKLSIPVECNIKYMSYLIGNNYDIDYWITH